MIPKIAHLNKHFNVFLNGPETFTLYEIHDIQFLFTLLNDENINSADKRTIRKFIKEAKKCAIIDDTSGPSIIPIQYSKTKNSGQYSSKLTLQHVLKSVKDQIYDHGQYVNLDIVNKGFTIIHEVAKINGIQLPILNEFIENRTETYEANQKCFNNSVTAKENFCHLIFGPVHFEGETPFIAALIDEIIFVNKIFQHPDYPEFTVGKIIEIYSTAIMSHIVDFLVLNGIIFPKWYSLNGDAIYFQPLNPFKIKDIENYIFEQTNFNIKMH